MADEDSDGISSAEECRKAQAHGTQWQMEYPSTPGNCHHVLMGHMYHQYGKPLIRMTPKSILSDLLYASAYFETHRSTSFKEVLPATSNNTLPLKSARKFALYFSKVHRDMPKKRDATQNTPNDFALVRIEQHGS